MTAAPAFARFRALGCLAVVGAADPTRLRAAEAAVRAEVDACDLACSRFREDSELSRLHALPGRRRLPASDWLRDAVAAALTAARQTSGLVDPTIGQCLVDLGYDRDFAEIEPGAPVVIRARHVPAWRRVSVDDRRGTLTVPAGVRLDLGATAKALCADRAARRAAAAGTGVLVSLGGDIAVAGPAPDGGWVVRVTDRADTDPGDTGAGPAVAVSAGGLATSGTAARRWGGDLHHIIDPRTGRPADAAWRTVSVAAASCVAANTASTAAVVLGAAAPAWLEERGLAARLVNPEGLVTTAGRWPADPCKEAA